MGGNLLGYFLVALDVKIWLKHLDGLAPGAIVLNEVENDCGIFVVVVVCVGSGFHIGQITNSFFDSFSEFDADSGRFRKDEKKLT